MNKLTLLCKTFEIVILERQTGTTIINCRGTNLDDRRTFMRVVRIIRNVLGTETLASHRLVNKLKDQDDQLWEGIV